MKSKKPFLSKEILILIIMVIFYGLFSCSEKPTEPPPPPNPLVVDSNFFDWHLDTARMTFVAADMYIADTNKIFLPGTLYGIFFDNGILKKIRYLDVYPNFKAYCVNGTNINNVYFGGSADDLTEKSKLLRWNGYSINDIELPNDSSQRILKIEVISDDDIWMSTDQNIIYHYNNSHITSYRLDNELSAGVIHKDNFGNLYSKFSKYFPGYPSNYLFYMFKYENDNWVQVYKDSVYGNNELRGYAGIVDNQIIREGLTGYYRFTGSDWIKYLNTNNLILPENACGGGGFNNVLFNGIEENHGILVFYYDGKQIYRQPSYYYPVEVFWEIQYKFGRFYLIMDSWDFFETYLVTATFKKTNSKILKQEKNEKNNFNIIRNNVIK